MSAPNISEIIRLGMNYERMRLEAAANNLAAANVALAPDGRSPLLQVITPTFAERLGQPSLQPVIDTAAQPATKLVLDPTHPLADANGYVRYPDVEPSREMATLVSASRAYEANIRAFNLLRSMQARGLDIGSKS